MLFRKRILGMCMLLLYGTGLASPTTQHFEHRIDRIEKRIQQLVDEKEWVPKGTLRWNELRKDIASLDEKFSQTEQQLSRLEKTKDPNQKKTIEKVVNQALEEMESTLDEAQNSR